jgi:hypothetical protein
VTDLSLSTQIESLLNVRWNSPDEVAAADQDALGDSVRALIEDPALQAESLGTQLDVLRHVQALYGQSWHRSATQLSGPVERLFARYLGLPEFGLDEACMVYDLLYLLYWCSTGSFEEQRCFGDRVVTPFTQSISVRWPSSGLPRSLAGGSGRRLRVALLSQFCVPGGGNAIAGAVETIVRALGQHRSGAFDLYLYAWMFHDADFLARLAELGARVRALEAGTYADRLAQIETGLQADEIDVAITDMNSALPTVLFERRGAPIQIYFQLGMPFWPVREIDGVFRTWQPAPERMGFEARKCFDMTGSWNLAELNPAVDPSAIERERSELPVGVRTIGSYGRLAKITPAYMQIVRGILDRNTGVVAVLGGVGDPGPIREFVAQHALTDRVYLIHRYVDGHAWGHILDVFLDTFPVQGGASCREVVAKGKPVVSMLSPETPNLARERLAALVATDAMGYEDTVCRLLQDPEFYRSTCIATAALAAKMPDALEFAARLEAGIRQVIAMSRPRHPLRKLVANMLDFRFGQ